MSNFCSKVRQCILRLLHCAVTPSSVLSAPFCNSNYLTTNIATVKGTELSYKVVKYLEIVEDFRCKILMPGSSLKSEPSLHCADVLMTGNVCTLHQLNVFFSQSGLHPN